MRVGTSSQIGRLPKIIYNHPHACGDKLNMPLLHLLAFGIIPMRVGTRSMCGAQAMKSWDHPHACGDKCTYAHCTGIMQGSSPCVWGQGH